ncbi:hypothetical protein NHX12_025109 [Muraenolepis orangiensis]|uniref:Uncharacterized protein n=1 Tax=Muraenolepis orangiensis TaxID=630683 RepID=A0A9Q0EIR2_9TELE|nr:hypothetical protein NHX12_025109 [Muraenolepis orangiensis]
MRETDANLGKSSRILTGMLRRLDIQQVREENGSRRASLSPSKRIEIKNQPADGVLRLRPRCPSEKRGQEALPFLTPVGELSVCEPRVPAGLPGQGAGPRWACNDRFRTARGPLSCLFGEAALSGGEAAQLAAAGAGPLALGVWGLFGPKQPGRLA